MSKKIKQETIRSQKESFSESSESMINNIIQMAGLQKFGITEISKAIYKHSLLTGQSKGQVAWSVIAHLLKEPLSKVIMIDHTDVYVNNEYGVKEHMCHVKAFPWITLLNKLTDNSQGINTINSTKSALIELLKRNVTTATSVIQFNDYYIQDSHIKEGIYEGIPQFYIKRSVKNIICERTFTKRVTEVDDLYDHLSSNNDDSKKYFLAVLSTMFMNSPLAKKQYESKILNLYGETGGNGKSTFLDFLSASLNDQKSLKAVSTSFSITDLGDNYISEMVAKHLIAIDYDASDSGVNHNSSRLLKAMSSGDTVTVRGIRESPYSVRPNTLFITASNKLIKTFDKSGGMARRNETIEINRKLIKPSEWFDKLNSEESYQYNLELILDAFIKLKENGKMYDTPQKVRLSNEASQQNNDNTLGFVEDLEESAVHDMPVALVRERYEEYCELNALGKPLSSQKLNSSLRARFGERLTKRKKRIRFRKDTLNGEAQLTHHGHIIKFDGQSVECWVIEDSIE